MHSPFVSSPATSMTIPPPPRVMPRMCPPRRWTARAWHTSWNSAANMAEARNFMGRVRIRNAQRMQNPGWISTRLCTAHHTAAESRHRLPHSLPCAHIGNHLREGRYRFSCWFKDRTELFCSGWPRQSNSRDENQQKGRRPEAQSAFPRSGRFFPVYDFISHCITSEYPTAKTSLGCIDCGGGMML